MLRRGYDGIVSYIDDFFLSFESYDKCNAALHELIRLVRRLGFHVNWKKLSGPSTTVTFLGVQIDTINCTLAFRQEKLTELRARAVLY